MSDVSLRTYAYIDRLQPQCAAHIAATCQGDVPIAGMAELFIEMAPGNEVFRVADVALKAADVRPALQIIEREFGLLELHSESQAEVLAAGSAVLAELGVTESERVRPTIASSQFITNVHPYQAQLLNKFRKGALLIPGRSLFVLEVAPAAYAGLAANEAEKAATIDVVEIRAVGRFGRGSFLAGSESEVATARDAAVGALGALGRRRMRVIGVKEVEAAKGTLAVGPNDVVTPLALERAAELGITIDGARSSKDARGSPPLAVKAPTTEPPPSGALYRRGAPVATARVRPPQIFGAESRPAPRRKSGRVTVVGAGHVGATTAMRLAEADVFAEVVMTDVVPGLAAGLSLDLWHSSGLRGFATHLRGTTDPAEAGGSDFVVVTAGRARQPGMSRSDLTVANSAIVSEVAEAIALHSPDAIVVIVTNPLDEMTHLAWQRTGFPAERVMGMAGVLDTTRFCALVALATGQRPDEVSAVALGSHGEEMVIPLSQARIQSQPIERHLDAAKLKALVERARDSGAEVVRLLERGSAYYAPAAAVARMVLAMANDTREVLPACVMANGAYGINDVFLGLPARLGADGVTEIVELNLSAGELEGLRTAARRIAERVGQLAAG